MNEFETFSQLHYSDKPLLIGNAWDVASAKLFEEAGFKAIATSSAAIAGTMGYGDGQHIPFGAVLEIVKRIKKAITVPLSVDMERGYAFTLPGIIANVEKLCDAGVAGINIEDSTGDARLKKTGNFQKIISGIASQLARKNRQLFINVRTDAFLLRLPNALEETVFRANAYEAAGASGIFVPFIDNLAAIKKVVGSCSVPLNVFVTKQLPDFNELAVAGVKRISLGSSVYNHQVNIMRKNISLLLQEQTASGLF